MATLSRELPKTVFVLSLPLFWGFITFGCLMMFDIYRFEFAKTSDVYWLLRMALFIPIWLLLRDWNLLDMEMDCYRIGSVSMPLGNWKFWLGIAYVAALMATFAPPVGFLTRATFGAIISPIFEEYMARSPLRRWFKDGYLKLFGMAVISSVFFSIMHWFYLPDLGASMSFPEHIQKFIAHFIFGMVMAILYFITKRIQVPLAFHIISNLQWVPKS